MSDPVSTLDGAVAETGQTIRIADRGPVGQITLRGNLTSPALQRQPGRTLLGRVPRLMLVYPPPVEEGFE